MNLRSGVVTGLIVLGSSVVCMNAAMAQQSGSPQTVSAYDYIGLQLNDHDQGDDSLSVHGSYSFQNPFFVNGYYRNLDSDNFGSNRHAYGVGFGRYWWLENGIGNGLWFDVQGRLGRIDFGQADTNFWGVDANLRQRIDQFEIYGGIGYRDYTDAGDDTVYQFGLDYYLNSDFSVGVGYEDSEFGDGLKIKASYHF